MNRLPPRIEDANMKETDLTGADRCKKNLQNRNLFIGHSVKRSFVRSFMMSYLSGKKSRLILHSIVPNIRYKGRRLLMSSRLEKI